MPSTFFGLNIAYTGLTAANAALNTTANNIANVETDGYSRQTVTQQASQSIRTYTTYGCVGAGVDTLSIDRNRDVFYDFKYWNNNNKVGEYEEKQYYMKQIEDLFSDDKTIKGFNSIYNELQDSLSELQKNAGDVTTRNQMLGFANNLAYYFNTVSENLRSMQLDANAEIMNKVSEINSYAAEIASLNEQINVIELTGPKANELRDRRDAIIDKLSEVVSVEVDEVPVHDTNNPDRLTGANRYIVKIAGGQLLVDANDYHQIECKARENYEATNQSDALGLYELTWDNGNDFNISSARIGGQLQGLLAVRDGNNGENFKGTVADGGVRYNADKNLNEIVVDVKAPYLQDLNKCTLPPDGGKIQIGNKEYYFDSFEVIYNDKNEITQYIFDVSPNPEKNFTQPDEDRIGKDVSIGAAINYQGIPYYQQQINEWVRTYAEAFNKILTQEGAVDAYGNSSDVMFVANEATSEGQRKFVDARNMVPGTPVKSKDDSYYYLTASNFAISKEMLEDPKLLSTHTDATAGQDAYDVVMDLISLRTDKNKMSFRGSSSGEFLQCILSDISLNASSANAFSESYQNISKIINTQRLSISGVDTDEESLNLVQFQHSYNLASKLIQTLTEMYDRLITQTGV